jgi:hypothetical protein
MQLTDVTTENWGRPFTNGAIRAVFPIASFIVRSARYDHIDLKGHNQGWTNIVDRLIFCISGKLTFTYENGVQIAIEAGQIAFVPAGRVSDNLSNPPVAYIMVLSWKDITERIEAQNK